MSDIVRIPPVGDSVSIFAVIVLYKMGPDESLAFTTLMASLNRVKQQEIGVKVLLYDNTPGPRYPGDLPANVHYEAAGQNNGLAVAYNRALDCALESGAPWLLLLDQDTGLPPDFLASLLVQINKYATDFNVAALVPIIRDGGIVSPKRMTTVGLRALPKDTYGIQKAEIMSFNSGTAIRCQFMSEIKGFNGNYWLDFLDHWLFRRIYAEGKQAAIFDCVLEHSLSAKDYRRNIDRARYHSILCGESAFITTYRPKVQIPVYLLRLLARAARMTLRGRPDLAALTLVRAAKIMVHPNRSLEGTYNERQFGACDNADG